MFSLIRRLSNGSSSSESQNEAASLNEKSRNETGGENRAQQQHVSVQPQQGVLTEAQIGYQLELLHLGALSKTSNEYVGYVFKLVTLFTKLWEAHLEWATSHITNHLAAEMAMGELLFAREEAVTSEDEGAIKAASALEMVLSTGRYRYFLCLRSIKAAERELQLTLQEGQDRSAAAIDCAGASSLQGGRADMTTVISRSLKSVVMEIYDRLYQSTMDQSVQPRVDRSKYREEKRVKEEEREAVEAFGAVWASAEPPLLTSLELLWPASGVDAEIEMNNAVLMEACGGDQDESGVSSPTPQKEGGSVFVSSTDRDSFSSSDRVRALRDSQLYRLIKGQCLQAFLRTTLKLRHPKVDLTPLHTPRSAAVGAEDATADLNLNWRKYHRLMDAVHRHVDHDHIVQSNELADTAMYCPRLCHRQAEVSEDFAADQRYEAIDEGASRPGALPGQTRTNLNEDPSVGAARANTEPWMGESSQWAALVHCLWDVRDSLPQPLPDPELSVPQGAGAASLASLAVPISVRNNPKQPFFGYTIRPVARNAVFVDRDGNELNYEYGLAGEDEAGERAGPSHGMTSPRTATNTTVWVNKKQERDRKEQREAANSVGQAYAQATREQRDFYEMERQQERERSEEQRRLQHEQYLADYEQRQVALLRERTCAYLSLQVVDEVSTAGLLQALKHKGIHEPYLPSRMHRSDQRSEKVGEVSTSDSSSHHSRGGNVVSFRQPPQERTPWIPGDGEASAGSTGSLGGVLPSPPTTQVVETINEGGMSPLVTTEEPSLASSMAPQLPARSSTPGSPQHLPRGNDDPGDPRMHSEDTFNPESSLNSDIGPPVDPTNIAVHGKLAYLPDDSALSQDFNLSHGSAYFDLDEVAQPENPEDRDARSIVGEGAFAHTDSADMYKGEEAWPSIAEDSLEEYPYNTNQLGLGGMDGRETAKANEPLAGIIRGNFLNMAAPSVGSDMSHPYRQHNRRDHTYSTGHGGHIHPGTSGLGMNQESLVGMSESLVTMHHEESETCLPAEGSAAEELRGGPISSGPLHFFDSMRARSTAHTANEGSSEALGDAKVSLSNELSHVSKVFPSVETYRDGSNASKAAVEAHWSLSLKSLPTQTEEVHMTTSEGVKLVYTSVDSRPELQRPEWKLRLHDELPSPVREEGAQKPAQVLPGGKSREEEGQTFGAEQRPALHQQEVGLLAPSMTSSIATGDLYHQHYEEMKPFFAPKIADNPDERMAGEAEAAAVVEERRLNEGKRRKREDDDASIDHKIIPNDQYESSDAAYLPFDVDPADDESLVTADLMTPRHSIGGGHALSGKEVQNYTGHKEGELASHAEERESDDFDSFKFFDNQKKGVSLLTKDNVRSHSNQFHRYDHDKNDHHVPASDDQGTRLTASDIDGGPQAHAVAAITDDTEPDEQNDFIAALRAAAIKAGALDTANISYEVVPLPINVRPTPAFVGSGLKSWQLQGAAGGGDDVAHAAKGAAVGSGFSGEGSRDGTFLFREQLRARMSAPSRSLASTGHDLDRRVGRSGNADFRLRRVGLRWANIDGKILFGVGGFPAPTRDEAARYARENEARQAEEDRVKRELAKAAAAEHDHPFGPEAAVAIAIGNRPESPHRDSGGGNGSSRPSSRTSQSGEKRVFPSVTEASLEEKIDAPVMTIKQDFAPKESRSTRREDSLGPLGIDIGVGEEKALYPPYQDDRLVPVIEWPYPDDAVFPTHLTVQYPNPDEPDGLPDAEDIEEEEEADGQKGSAKNGNNRKKKKEKHHLCAKAYDPKLPKSTVRKNLPGKYVYTPAPGTLLGTGHHSLSVTFIPRDLHRYKSVTVKGCTTIYIRKGTPVLDYTPIAEDDIMIAGTPIADKYFHVRLSEPNAAEKNAIFQKKAARGDSVWLGLVLPDAEIMKREKRRREGVEAIRRKVLLREQRSRARAAQARKAQREYATKLKKRGHHEEDASNDTDEESSDDDLIGQEEKKGDEHGEVATDGMYSKGPDEAALISQIDKSLADQLRDWHEGGEFLFSIEPGAIIERGTQKLVAQYRPSPFFSKLYNFAHASITFHVGARAPKWSWNGVNDIPYYTPLSTHQLKARIVEPSPTEPLENAPLSPPPGDPGAGWGRIVYDEENSTGKILEVGKQRLWGTFIPYDPVLFRKCRLFVDINITQVTSEIVWGKGIKPIYEGHPVTAAQLNARAEVPDERNSLQGGGTFDYSVEVGAILPLGEHPVTLTFTPEYPDRYTAVTLTNVLRVMKPGTPQLFWPELDPIKYPSPLTKLELAVRVASLNCTGKLEYDPPLGAVLPGGTHTLRCTFVPDMSMWVSTTISTKIEVMKARPALKWPEPAALLHGKAIKEHILCCKAVNEGLKEKNCLFTYTPPANSVLDLGRHKLHVHFQAINDDAPNYEEAEMSVELTVRQRPKRKTTLKWATRLPELKHPEKLGGYHCNAECDTKGMFVYTPNPGTVLSVGDHIIKVKFYPENSEAYLPAESSAKVRVTKGECTLTYTLEDEDCFFDYGRPLDRRILSAKCLSHLKTNIPGNYEYLLNGRPLDQSNEEAKRLDSGAHRITCKWTPSVAANFDEQVASVDVFVRRVKPTLEWHKPPPGVYPHMLTLKDHLNATCTTPRCEGFYKYSHQPTTPDDGDDDDAMLAMAAAAVTMAESTGMLEAYEAAIEKQRALKRAIADKKAAEGRMVNEDRGKQGQAEKVKPLGAGKHQLKVRFIPSDPVNFYSCDASVVWEVQKGQPVLETWDLKDECVIVYGQPIDAHKHLTARVDLDSICEYDYRPPAGTVLPVGRYNIKCTMTVRGEKEGNYGPLVERRLIHVVPQTPELIFDGAETDILTYGEPLSIGRHLNARLVLDPYADSDIALLGQAIVEERDAARMAEMKEVERRMRLAEAQAAIKAKKAKWRAENRKKEEYKKQIEGLAKEMAAGDSDLQSMLEDDKSASMSGAGSKTSAHIRRLKKQKAGRPRGYVYTPKEGTILSAGTHTVSVIYDPPDTSINIGCSLRYKTKVEVKPTKPAIGWKDPPALKYGEPLSEAQLCAGVKSHLPSVRDGKFEYKPPAGTILPVGSHTITCKFQPANVSSVEQAFKRTSVAVYKAHPTLSWDDAPEEVEVGYRITEKDLSATCVGHDGAPLEGKFVYTPSFGNVVGAVGTREMKVEFILRGSAIDNYFKPKPLVKKVKVCKKVA